jgi:hypothetical protein
MRTSCQAWHRGRYGERLGREAIGRFYFVAINQTNKENVWVEGDTEEEKNLSVLHPKQREEKNLSVFSSENLSVFLFSGDGGLRRALLHPNNW